MATTTDLRPRPRRHLRRGPVGGRPAFRPAGAPRRVEWRRPSRPAAVERQKADDVRCDVCLRTRRFELGIGRFARRLMTAAGLALIAAWTAAPVDDIEPVGPPPPESSIGASDTDRPTARTTLDDLVGHLGALLPRR